MWYQEYMEKREAEIRAIAHRLWEEAGCPNGDVLVSWDGKMIPLKQLHWELAVVEWSYGPDYFR